MQPLLKIQNVPISINVSSRRAEFQPVVKQSRPAATPRMGADGIPEAPKISGPQPDAPTGVSASAGVVSRTPGVEQVASTEEASLQAVEITGAPAVAPSAGTGAPMSRVMSNSETIVSNTSSGVASRSGGSSAQSPSPSSESSVEFVPGGVDVNVEQYHEVIIEYVGSPIYVPKSADPNYEPPAE